MNRIAFVFASAPHGTAAGREGLDALLAISSLTKDIGVFFIGDGVFQLLIGQQPQAVLARNYISTFKVLPFYDVERFWVCSDSLYSRGLTECAPMVLDTVVVSSDIIRKEIAGYNVVLKF